jgi:hypothetical protein
MKTPIGAAILAGIVAGIALIAVPTGLGAKPIRTVDIPGPRVNPAGLGCAFDVAVLPNDVTRIVEFSSGRVAVHVNAEPTFTNLDTRTSYVQRSRFNGTDIYEPETNDVLSVTSGRFVMNLYPGDQGPFGEVGENGALFAMVGTVYTTFDLDSELVTFFSYEGTVFDLCEALAG